MPSVKMRERLRLVFVEYGLGKYYIYTNAAEVKHPFIEMNINMYFFDKKLFYWVLKHELDHYVFFQEQQNEGKKDIANEFKQCMPIKENLLMLPRLAKFELIRRFKPYCKDFAVLEQLELCGVPETISYFKCDKRLNEEQEQEVIRFVGGVKDV